MSHQLEQPSLPAKSRLRLPRLMLRRLREWLIPCDCHCGYPRILLGLLFLINTTLLALTFVPCDWTNRGLPSVREYPFGANLIPTPPNTMHPLTLWNAARAFSSSEDTSGLISFVSCTTCLYPADVIRLKKHPCLWGDITWQGFIRYRIPVALLILNSMMLALAFIHTTYRSALSAWIQRQTTTLFSILLTIWVAWYAAYEGSYLTKCSQFVSEPSGNITAEGHFERISFFSIVFHFPYFCSHASDFVVFLSLASMLVLPCYLYFLLIKENGTRAAFAASAATMLAVLLIHLNISLDSQLSGIMYEYYNSLRRRFDFTYGLVFGPAVAGIILCGVGLFQLHLCRGLLHSGHTQEAMHTPQLLHEKPLSPPTFTRNKKIVLTCIGICAIIGNIVFFNQYYTVLRNEDAEHACRTHRRLIITACESLQKETGIDILSYELTLQELQDILEERYHLRAQHPDIWYCGTPGPDTEYHLLYVKRGQLAGLYLTCPKKTPHILFGRYYESTKPRLCDGRLEELKECIYSQWYIRDAEKREARKAKENDSCY